MARRKRVLELTVNERATLEAARDHHPKPYVRERAAALLLIAGGTAAYQVACSGILRPRHPETLYIWLNAFAQKRHRRPFSVAALECSARFPPHRHATI